MDSLTTGRPTKTSGNAPLMAASMGQKPKEVIDPITFGTRFPTSRMFGRALLAHMPWMDESRDKSHKMVEELARVRVDRTKDTTPLNPFVDATTSHSSGITERRRRFAKWGAGFAVVGIVTWVASEVGTAVSNRTASRLGAATTVPNVAPIIVDGTSGAATPTTVTPPFNIFTQPTTANTAPTPTSVVTPAQIPTNPATGRPVSIPYIDGRTVNCIDDGVLTVTLGAGEGAGSAFARSNPNLGLDTSANSADMGWVAANQGVMFPGAYTNKPDAINRVIGACAFAA